MAVVERLVIVAVLKGVGEVIAPAQRFQGSRALLSSAFRRKSSMRWLVIPPIQFSFVMKIMFVFYGLQPVSAAFVEWSSKSRLNRLRSG